MDFGDEGCEGRAMSVREEYPCFVGSEPMMTGERLEVYEKFSGKVLSRVSLAGADEIERGICAAVEAERAMREMAPYERRDVLSACAERFSEKAEELAEVLCLEAGKPMKASRAEVQRLIDTFEIASREAMRESGGVLNLEMGEASKGYRGMFRRVPVGVCSFISPFNFPLNLVAHKIAPAIAAGCPFILKPASKTPLGALMMGEILAETALPKGAFSILPSHREAAEAFTVDERVRLLSFTGSPDVGWDLKARAGKKEVILELGGNAAAVVDETADLDLAAERLVLGAFYQSGQSCISVQRIYVHADVEGEFLEKLLELAQGLRMGDPMDEETDLGPMISEGEAQRVEEWIGQAVEAGGKLLCGGKRDGSFVEATLLKDVPEGEAVMAEEVFGPVACVTTFGDFEEALREVNRSRFGIHAGVFTASLERAMIAWDELEVGGVLINEMPSWRVDSMPYGGVKDSGTGREGVRYAMEDMTEMRTLTIRA